MLMINGESAFPVPPTPDPTSGNPHPKVTWDSGFGGMSLRDWFAGMAISGITHSAMFSDGQQQYLSTLANRAYRFADAMLAERAKGDS